MCKGHNFCSYYENLEKLVKDIIFAVIDDGVHDEYLCPITREVMKDPVIAAGNEIIMPFLFLES